MEAGPRIAHRCRSRTHALVYHGQCRGERDPETMASAYGRLLMTIPGICQLTALAFVAAIDDASRHSPIARRRCRRLPRSHPEIPHRSLSKPGRGLAVETWRDLDRRSYVNVACNATAPRNLKKMGKERHVPVPRDLRSFVPSHRKPRNSRVIKINRLNDLTLSVPARRRLPRRFEMRGTEAHEAIAVARRALREQHNRRSCAHCFGDPRINGWDAGTPTAIDVNDALDGDNLLPHGMIADLFLRKETHGLERAEDRNVEPGDMVSHYQPLCFCAECAMPSHPDPETSTDKPVEQDGCPPPDAQAVNLGDPPRRTKSGQKRR